MSRLLIAAILSAKCALAGVAAESDPSGAWKLETSYGGRGGRISILKIQYVSDQLVGEILSSQGGRTKIENPQFSGNQLSFDVVREWDGREFISRYVGTIAGDRIKGDVEIELRGRTRNWKWVAARTTWEPVAQAPAVPKAAADIDLTDENYRQWRDHILPDAGELAWEQIPWLTTFKDGILAADAADKPLLLWTMNGHPLGCT